jgi:phosphatidylinositol glycan class M
MVLGCFYALSCRQTALGAILLGLATHFKIYPIIYAIPIMILLDSRYCNRSCAIINKERIQFAAVSATTFIGLTFWMYTL